MVKEAQKFKNGMGHFFVPLTISRGSQDGQLLTWQIILVEVLSELTQQRTQTPKKTEND
jgi:hypothetical protein